MVFIFLFAGGILILMRGGGLAGNGGGEGRDLSGWAHKWVFMRVWFVYLLFTV